MLVLSYGMTKSGSTLAFELCKAVLEARGFTQRKLPDSVVTKGHHVNFLSDVSASSVRALLEEIRDDEKIAVKLHAPADEDTAAVVEREIAAGRAKLHVNYRDPREVSLSLMDAGAQARAKNRKAFAEIETLADAARTTQRQLGNCRRWGAIRGAMHLFYNDVAFDMRATADRIARDFGLPALSDEEFAGVVKVLETDAFTQKNKAVKDRYKDELTIRQSEELVDAIRGAKPFIRRVCEARDYGWFTSRPSLEADAA